MRYFISMIMLLFITGHALAFKDNVAFVTAKSGLNIRSNPGVKAKKVDKITFGDKVYIIGWSSKKATIEGMTDYWYKVSFKDKGMSDWDTKKRKTGWVFGGYLTDQEITGFHKTTIARYKGKAGGDYLRLIVELPNQKEERFWKFRKFIGIIEYIKATQPDDRQLLGKRVRIVWAKRTVLEDEIPTGETIKEIDRIEILDHVTQKVALYYKTDPGQGIIVRESEGAANVIVFPDRIRAFDAPNGKAIGYVVNDHDEESYLKIFIAESNNDRYQIAGKDFFGVDNKNAALKYYQKTDRFIKIMKYSHQSGVWIKIDELRKNDYFDQKYFDYFVSARGPYVPESHAVIDLMDQPDSKSKHIFSVSHSTGNYRIRLTGNAKRNWAEVKIDEFKKNDTLKRTIINIYEGWINILDDKGFPKIEKRGNG